MLARFSQRSRKKTCETKGRHTSRGHNAIYRTRSQSVQTITEVKVLLHGKWKQRSGVQTTNGKRKRSSVSQTLSRRGSDTEEKLH